MDYFDQRRSIEKDPNEEQRKDDQHGIDNNRHNMVEGKNKTLNDSSTSREHQDLDYTKKERQMTTMCSRLNLSMGKLLK